MSIHKRILERITTIASISGSNDKKEILALSLGTPVQEYFIQFLNFVNKYVSFFKTDFGKVENKYRWLGH